jgi:hypothetical protein
VKITEIRALREAIFASTSYHDYVKISDGFEALCKELTLRANGSTKPPPKPGRYLIQVDVAGKLTIEESIWSGRLWVPHNVLTVERWWPYPRTRKSPKAKSPRRAL